VPGVDGWARSPAPTFGQHNAEVLTELLGCTPAELDDLQDAGVIASRPSGC
jgi:crotonobetainyl-CoA:carnitine CoA-transferase CaiB-like acyl-CoA transferase